MKAPVGRAGTFIFPQPEGMLMVPGPSGDYAGTYKPDRLQRALHLFRHERVAKKT